MSNRAAWAASVCALTFLSVMAGIARAQWVPFSPPDSLPDRDWPTSVYDPVNDRIYMIGGETDGMPTGANQRFDPSRDTWATMAPMPTPRRAIEGAYIRGKIYIAGGDPGNLDVNEEYTIAANSWQTRAPLPVATLAYQVGVWRDSLMYVMGGMDPNFNGTETVRVYNPFANTWAVGTPMPEEGDMGAGTIVGDTIYITGSYNRPTGRLWAEMLRGAINPADPTQITWLWGPRLPEPVASQGTASLHGKVYWFGGLTETGPATRRGWVYDPATGGVDSILSLPPTVGLGLARCGAAGRETSNELFQVAGFTEDTAARPYHKIQLAPPSVEEESRCDFEPVTLGVRTSAAGRGVQIRYALRHVCWVRLQVQDITGRVVRVLASARMQAGEYTVSWDGRDRGGRLAGGGVYFCRLQAGEFAVTKKTVKTE